jgi:2-amino-4-hydroxy-6-hydroxymethyldihydropteridine diphosphokinase
VAAALAYIGLGSNLAHPRRQLARAVRALRRLPATTLLKISRHYATAPQGTGETQPDYVNAVAAVRTALAPRALLRRLLAIERRQHRRRGADAVRNAPRTLDLDLLLYERRRMRSRDLTLPHPRLHLRAFALRPLFDVAPAITIPGRGLAHREWRAVRAQRIAPTRTHCLR